MRILIVSPAKRGSRLGNQITADRWAQILRSQKHTVSIKQGFDPSSSQGNYDLLIALHARRSAKSVSEFRRLNSDGKIVVAITGTDIHEDLGKSSLVEKSFKLADRIVALEPECLKKLSRRDRRKSSVILQSSTPLANPPKKLLRVFEVSILGHLRAVKDPFRAAMAVRRLPESSRIKVVHFGSALTPSMEQRALKESKSNARYHWFGSVPHGEAQRRLARSRLSVLTSKSEGGPAAVVESIVNDVPVLGTRIDAMVGMLGDDYPGLFECGDTTELRRLILLAENDQGFLDHLLKKVRVVKPNFSRPRENKAWRELIAEVKEP